MVNSNTPQLNMRRLLEGSTQNVQLLKDHFTRLDALMNLVVESVVTSAEPLGVAVGVIYAVPGVPTGPSWQEYGDHLMIHSGGGLWLPVPLRTGMRAFVKDEGNLRVWNGAAWIRDGATRRITVRLGHPLFGGYRVPLFRTTSTCQLVEARFAPRPFTATFSAQIESSSRLDGVATINADGSDFDGEGICLFDDFTEPQIPINRWVYAELGGTLGTPDGCLQVTYTEALI